MSDLEFRSIPFTDLEVRDDSDSGGWSLEGIAVPYGQVVEVGDYKESIERGAFGDYDGSSLLFSAHDHQAGGLPIGSITETEDRDEGLFVRAKISATAKGTEVRQLVKDGVLKALSVGFQPVEQRDEDGVVVRTKARLREVSVVPFPAYADAAITAVRSKSSSASADDNQKEVGMADTTAADVTEVRSHVEDLSRRFTVLEERGTGSAVSPISFRSEGEFVKALAAGDPKAREQRELLVRAYTGATVADHGAQRPGWIDRDLKQIAQNRDVLEFFAKDALPAEGMTVTYPVFSSATGDVSVQAAEGNDLTYIEIATTTATAPVKTYGGYSSLSRQLIERSSVSFLNATLQAQRLSYAKVTNAAVRAALTATTGTNTGTVTFATKSNPMSWVNVAAAAAADISTNSYGLNAGAWVMGRDQALALASISDSANRPVFVINGDGVNSIGDLDLRSLKMNVGGLPVLVDFGLTGTNSYVVAREAVTVLEDGAKYLQDDNIINLTRDYSIYGYMAITVNDPKGVAKISHPAS